MRISFGQLFVDSLRRSWNAVFVVGAFLITFIPLTGTLKVRWVLFGAFWLMLLVSTFWTAAYQAWKATRPALPKVVYSTKPVNTDQGVSLLCLLEPSELFSYGAMVSFYYVEDTKYEQLLGVGVVLNVQDDRRVLVGLVEVLPGHDDVLVKLRENNGEYVKRTRVKPQLLSPLLRANMGGEYI